MKAIIIEDEQSAADNLSYLLKSVAPDIQIIESIETVSDAIAFFKENKAYDLVFMDMQMPVMDGAQLGEHLKANDHLKSMKLIMMTSMCHKGDAKFFANLGSKFWPLIAEPKCQGLWSNQKGT